jgi:hypothetical protein
MARPRKIKKLSELGPEWQESFKRNRDSFLANAPHSGYLNAAYTNIDERRLMQKRRAALRGTDFVNDPYR